MPPRACGRCSTVEFPLPNRVLVPLMTDSTIRRVPAVGITFVKARLSNRQRVELGSVELEFLVDSGAVFSVAPAGVLESLDVERLERQELTLADGTHVAYDVGEVTFAVGDRAYTSKVVFAPAGVTPLLGALTLESLGLMLNPVTRELLPMRLFLARAS